MTLLGHVPLALVPQAPIPNALTHLPADVQLALFQRMVNLSAEALFVVSPKDDYRFLLVNDAAADLLGVEPGQLIGSRLQDHDPFFAPDWIDSNRVTLRQRQALIYDTSLPHECGPKGTIEVSLHYFLESGFELLIGTFKDINYQKHAIPPPRAGEDFRTLAENSPDVIVRYARDGRRTYVNPAYQVLSGIPPADLIGKLPSEHSVLPLDKARQIESQLANIVETGQAHDFVLEWVAPDNQHHCYQVRAVPERDDQGQVHGILTLARDVSSLRSALQRLDGFADSVPGFMFSYLRQPDGRGVMPFASAGIEQVFGLRPEDVACDAAILDTRTQPDDLARIREALAVSERDQTPIQVEFRTQHPDRGELWVEARATPVREPSGRTLWHGFMIDITDRKRAEDLLFAREQMFQTLVEHSPDTVCRYDTQARRIYANTAFARLVGAPEGQLLNRPPSVVPASRSAVDYEEKILKVAQTGQPGEHELTWTTGDGSSMTSHIRLTPERDRNGNVISVLAVGRDVTALKHTEARLKSAQRLARLDSWEWDLRSGLFTLPGLEDGAPLQVNGPEDLAWALSGRVHPADIRTITERIEHAFADEETSAYIDFRGIAPNGDQLDMVTQIRIQYDTLGAPDFVWGTTQDISELRRAQHDLHSLAYYDTLTRLPNRTLFLDRLQEAVERAAKLERRLAVLILDLDNFKIVIDTHGHTAGDSVLRETADRLQSCLPPPRHVVARLGGDEFAVVLADVPHDDALESQSASLLSVVSQAFHLSGMEVFLTASIGISRFPEDGRTTAELMQHADSAMYQAKEQGRNQFRFHSVVQTSRRTEWLALATALHRAVDNNELELYYQPQVDLATCRLVGVEALLRWNHPDGQVAPDRFIGIAEDTGLIIDIGEWVLRTACRAACDWNRHETVPFQIAVNLSPRQMKAPDFRAMIQRVLADTGCNPAWLEFEITEGILLDNSIDIQQLLRDLRGIGLSFAIDDFGTGYSALGYLNRFPIDKLKIDRSFICNITVDRDAAELVKAIIAMSRSLRLDLVAEGVEDDAQESFLQAYGCQGAQGYFYGRPMPRAQFEAWLADRR